MACTGQVNEKINDEKAETETKAAQPAVDHYTTFPQIHTNLNGMVREFVRIMYQDTKGNYWFGTNGDGIIRYDGDVLEKMKMEQGQPHMRVQKNSRR